MDARGVSPVVGIALLIAITLLLATVYGVAFGHFGDLSDEEERVDDLLADPGGSGNYSDQDLVPVKDIGDGPRTSGGDILEFRLENTQDQTVSVVAIQINATNIDANMAVDDNNADEVEIRRVERTGKANRDGSPADFAADGTEYELVDDSTTDGQDAEIGRDDVAEVDIRRFTRSIGTLTITDSSGDADLTVTLILGDGSEQRFYFEQ